MSVLSSIAFLSFIASLVIGIVAWVINNRARFNQLLALAMGFYALHSLSQVFVLGSQELAVVRFFFTLSAMAATLFYPAIISFVLMFTGTIRRWRWYGALPVALVAAGVALFVVPAMVSLQGFRTTILGNAIILPPAPEPPIPLVFLGFAAGLAIFALLYRAYHRSGSRRYRAICVTSMVIISTSMVLNLVSELAAMPMFQWPSLGIAIGLLNPLAATLYYILKYRFLTLDFPLVEKGLITTVDDALLLVDADLKVTKANPAALRWFGEQALVGTNLSSWFSDPPLLGRLWAEATTARDRRTAALTLGTGPAMELTLSPRYDEFGDLIGGIAIGRDRPAAPAPVMPAEPAADGGRVRRWAHLDVNRILERLDTLFRTERLYTSMNLRLATVARRLSLSVHQLSAILNEVRRQSFSDLLKEYRVQEAKRLLRHAPGLSILEVAYESGFNSKTSFNAAFKKKVGLTPGQYRTWSQNPESFAPPRE